MRGIGLSLFSFYLVYLVIFFFFFSFFFFLGGGGEVFLVSVIDDLSIPFFFSLVFFLPLSK